MKKGKDNPLLILFLLAVAATVFIVGASVLLIPIVLLYLAIKAGVGFVLEKKSIRVRTSRAVRASKARIEDFWLTEREKLEFASASRELANAISAKDAANREADQKGLSRNQDGRLARRSNRGKQLREIMDSADDRIPGLQSTYAEWQNLPVRRYKRLVGGFRRFLALSSGVTAFAAAAYLKITEKH